MKIILTLILIILTSVKICFSQEVYNNELPYYKTPFLSRDYFAEIGNCYYYNELINTKITKPGYYAKPNVIYAVKANFKLKTLLKKQLICGDTSNYDSIVEDIRTTSNSEKIFYTWVQQYKTDSINSIIYSIKFCALDTNLNIVVPPTTLQKISLNDSNKWLFTGLQNMHYFGDRILLSYFKGKKSYSGKISYAMVISENGKILKDSIIGMLPDTTNYNIIHQAVDISKVNNNRIVFGGRGLIDALNSEGLVFMDSNLNITETKKFDIDVFKSESIKGYPVKFPNLIALPTGSIISGASTFYINKPFLYKGYSASALTKLSRSNNFKSDSTVFIFGMDSFSNTGNLLCIHALSYHSVENRVYFVNGMQLLKNLNCDGYNYLSVVNVDTNLNTKWVKYITPKDPTCVQIYYVASSDQRSGVDIIGRYRDYYAPNDTSLSGDFIIHIDSLGYLDVKSQENFNIRDRVMVYPNPAKDFVTVDDYQNQLDRLELMDMLGRRVISKKASSKTETMDISPLAPGNYLLRICLKDGQYLTKKVVRE